MDPSVVASLPELSLEEHRAGGGLGRGDGARVHHQLPAVDSGLDPPYVIAIVEFPEQIGLRLTTSVRGCEPDAVYVGMRVRVVFDNYEECGFRSSSRRHEPGTHHR